MSNFPHSTSISVPLSTSPFALNLRLGDLIAHSNSDQRRMSDSEDGPSGQNGRQIQHRSSNLSNLPTDALIKIPPNNSSEPIIDETLLFEGEDGQDVDENTPLTKGVRTRRQSERSNRSRLSYGTISTPLSMRRKSAAHHGQSGTSRSRSKARTPPRKQPIRESASIESSEGGIPTFVSQQQEDDVSSPETLRGRNVTSRPLSRSNSTTDIINESTYSNLSFRNENMGASTKYTSTEDFSGDEDEDVIRGLVGNGGDVLFGGKMGLGLVGGGMDIDPAEELNAQDLELPVGDDGRELRVWTEALRAEIPLILRSSIPVFFTQIAEWSLVLASVVSIGHLGTTELAAASLASMTASVSCFSILQGLATALDTLLPAAWTSSDPSRVGLWTQRISDLRIPMYLLWWNIEGILLMLGQEADVARRSSTYLRWLSIGIPGYGGNVIIKKYLQSQNLMHIPTYVLFIAAPINLVLNYLLVWGPAPFRLGFTGGALATALSYTLTFALSTGWVLFYGPREAFHPLTSTHVFSKLGTVTSLGLAGTIMLSSEWWAWEACALAASLLGPTTLAAQSVLLSTASTFWQVPGSLGIASAVRCGNLLGAGRGWEAKWASRASLFLSIAFALVNSTICMAFRKNWGYLFNSDPLVVDLVARIMPYIALFQVADGMAATSGSVLRSLGLHTTGALINLTSYYIFGLPIGLFLTFNPTFDLGLAGLWLGLSIALGYASTLSLVLVWRADWPRAVERVRERLGLVGHGELEDGKWVNDVDDYDRLLNEQEGPVTRI
ncbi:MATE family multidrug resistance protein [Tremella mesenterica]|uniref:MATE family multidrug resistance protein n=1 Tax=Tremella mesenterica TaxID=5217 RepID=A0A4Q1BAC7_TREME|nr:MATE family multidrug resistance protein [Tremella mesenterica]